MKTTLLKMTSQVDLTTIARSAYDKDTPFVLFSTYVEYEDDPVTQAIFHMRRLAHNANGNVHREINDPHSFAALLNERIPEECGLIIDGLNFLTSNIMLRTNSHEEFTYRTAQDLILDEIRALWHLSQTLNLKYLFIISADMQADPSLATFQGKTYQRLLNEANFYMRSVLEPEQVYTALSAGAIRGA